MKSVALLSIKHGHHKVFSGLISGDTVEMLELEMVLNNKFGGYRFHFTEIASDHPLYSEAYRLFGD